MLAGFTVSNPFNLFREVNRDCQAPNQMTEQLLTRFGTSRLEEGARLALLQFLRRGNFLTISDGSVSGIDPQRARSTRKFSGSACPPPPADAVAMLAPGLWRERKQAHRVRAVMDWVQPVPPDEMPDYHRLRNAMKRLTHN
jgi:hypothetical protein